MIGTTVAFTCYLKKLEKAVKWTFEGNRLPNNVKLTTIHGKFPKSILNIESVQRFNVGTYTCHGKNIQEHYFEGDGVLDVLDVICK